MERLGASHQPVLRRGHNYEASFQKDKADFRRHDDGIDTHRKSVVSAEDNAEVRRVSLNNARCERGEIELTSYAELCST